MFILGAGILGQLALETAIRAGLKVSGFYDDFSQEAEIDGVPILGRFEDFRENESAAQEGVFIAIGDNYKRKACVDSLNLPRTLFINIIDPCAIISPSATLAEGNLLLPGCYVGTKVILGSHNIVLPGVGITHHNNIGNYCFLAPMRPLAAIPR